ncbi:acyl-CoA dehydrogenase [Nonomuraea sp. MG754425]|uniref:acyl-CoA dehydrogenase family protein n=1 Tax=Nonomuraea sp. MG754425 TaxID=2570319 RepID=UPI001F31F6D8|nr:acyl-CoA dehydrogenase family protein [Nonomuraea sp. MG754425]MCF6471517.1 acyl-CoA dehydrogenase [Nonomuraea sp. MG754425]
MSGLDELRRRAAELLPELAAGAGDRELARELPRAQIRALAAAGLLTFRIPVADGGAGAGVAEVFDFLVSLAAADSNIAQALRPGFGRVEHLLTASPAERERWFPRFLAGDVFGNAGWEVGGASGEVRTRIDADGVVNGSKYYSTGALYADWISAAAVDDSGEKVFFTLPRDREGLELVDDFDGIGQRLTASGTTRLNGVKVHPGEFAKPPPRSAGRSPVSAFMQLYLAAVQAGIARNALTDAVAFARERSRPIQHSDAARSVDDPYVRHAVGEISARAYAAEAAVLRAAAAIDRAWAGELAPDLLTEAAVEVAQAQYVAAESALRAAELLFDVGGGSAVARRHNLDRHWRNARTVTNHNPRAWKAAVVGAYRLTGAQPPVNGLF